MTLTNTWPWPQMTDSIVAWLCDVLVHVKVWLPEEVWLPDRQTHRQTDAGQSDPYVAVWYINACESVTTRGSVTTGQTDAGQSDPYVCKGFLRKILLKISADRSIDLSCGLLYWNQIQVQQIVTFSFLVLKIFAFVFTCSYDRTLIKIVNYHL